ncbi:MAG: hypothetical protein HC909_02950 [Blastochloris sp.]|nr:hypothetical protein [Blastochloris sp.]
MASPARLPEREDPAGPEAGRVLPSSEEKLLEAIFSEGGGLPPGGGGPTSACMEERVAKLEVRADGVERRLESIENKLDRISERLATLPSRDQLLAIVGIALAVALAIAGITFQIAD